MRAGGKLGTDVLGWYYLVTLGESRVRNVRDFQRGPVEAYIECPSWLLYVLTYRRKGSSTRLGRRSVPTWLFRHAADQA